MDGAGAARVTQYGSLVDGAGLSASPGVAGPGSLKLDPYVAAFLNRKGGVGKTSCCHHLAGSFASAGRRVLLIDADPQASLTKGLIGPERTEWLPKEETIACLYDDAYEPDPARLIRQTEYGGVSLVPSSAHLDTYNRPDPERCGSLQVALRSFIDEVRDGFDTVLIDCPPTLY